MIRLLNFFQDLLDATRSLDFLAPLALRLYLAPVFWMAGTHKLAEGSITPSEDIISWFGNPEWGLGLPAPELMAYLATYTEILGAIMLLIGFAVRWVSIPLMVTMVVAAVTVHWPNGWQAVHDLKSPFASEHAAEAIDRLDKAKSLLEQHGDINWLTEYGNYVVLNNGIEWAATYFIMLLALFFLGAGRFFSIDYWLHRNYRIED